MRTFVPLRLIHILNWDFPVALIAFAAPSVETWFVDIGGPSKAS